jgi:hypothetical protein
MFNLLTVAAATYTPSNSTAVLPSREECNARRAAASLAAAIENAVETLREADATLTALVTVDASGIHCGNVSVETEEGICFMSLVEKVSTDTGLQIIL